MNRELLVIEEQTMHLAPLDDDWVLIQRIHQWDPSIVDCILCRRAIEAGAEFNFNGSYIVKERAHDANAQTETEHAQNQWGERDTELEQETTTTKIDLKAPSMKPKIGDNKKKKHVIESEEQETAENLQKQGDALFR